jgi:hypothetical protein
MRCVFCSRVRMTSLLAGSEISTGARNTRSNSTPRSWCSLPGTRRHHRSLRPQSMKEQQSADLLLTQLSRRVSLRMFSTSEEAQPGDRVRLLASLCAVAGPDLTPVAAAALLVSIAHAGQPAQAMLQGSLQQCLEEAAQVPLITDATRRKKPSGSSAVCWVVHCTC